MYVYYVRMCLFNRMHGVFIKMSVYCCVVASPSSLFAVCTVFVAVCVCVFVCVGGQQ